MAIAVKRVDTLWMSSCGILLNYDDKQYQKHRLMGFGLDTADPSFSQVQAIRLALTAINHTFRRTKIIIHLPDCELLTQLANPTECHIGLLRRYSFFTDVGFLVEPANNQYIIVCQKLAQKIRDNQTTFDSLTKDGLYYEE
jgi:hypothetical protein